jgi:KaiC/GvpD/RAD55 family RecA-like ATPase
MIRPLCNLTVRRLEHIFHVPGLPLVAKSDPERHTTSILVRGGPGTGKTTLALALGQAIAADGGGALVYLTTEFSPAEIRFKAELLRFDEQDVKIWAWDGVTRTATIDAPTGTVFVHHVSPPEPSEELEAEEMEVTSGSKKQFILESAWRLLGDGLLPVIAGVPVRALVIDAFILPDYGSDDAEVRSDLVAFIQALETLGVTPVLVEEVAPDSPSWFPFIVDLVFHLAHTKSAEGEWMRTMSCTKSRYGLVSAGPHTYSLSDGRPALFPTMRHTASGVASVSRPLRFALPNPGSGDIWHLVTGHQVILSPYEAGGGFFNGIGQTPGAVTIAVRFGFPCTITGPRIDAIVDEGEGPAVLAWSVLDAVAAGGANVVVFTAISRVLRREPWRRPVEQLIDALRRLGLVVIVVDDHAAIKALVPLADIVVSPMETGAQEGQLQLRLPSLVPFLPPPFVFGLASIEGNEDDKVPGQLENPLDAAALVSSPLELGQSPRWCLSCAWVAGNIEAMDVLEQIILGDYRRHGRLAARLLRARAVWQGVDAADRSADRMIERAPRKAEFPWLTERSHAEIRLEREETRSEGVSMLQRLLAVEAVSSEHRAEIAYNIAVAFMLGGNSEGGMTMAKRSLELRPQFFPAKSLVESLVK